MEKNISTYKAVTRPILECASTIWSPIASATNIKKTQNIYKCTSCTPDSNIQHMHAETIILPLHARSHVCYNKTRKNI